jgi:hypothetical protein
MAMLRRLISIVAACGASTAIASSWAAPGTLPAPAAAGATRVPAASSPSPAKPAFELCSRSLIEGPSRTVAFSGEDVLLGTGCGIAVFRGGSIAPGPAFVPIQGEPREIVVRGPLAYVAAYSGGLEVIDLSAPGAPREVYREGSVEPGSCALAGGALFATDARGRIVPFDLANPREPRPLEPRELRDAVLSLSGENDLLAVLSQRSASIFRVSAGGALRALCEVPVEEDIRKGALRGGVLFVLTAKGDILSWDLANPARPTPLKRLPIHGIADFAADAERGAFLTNTDFVIPFEIGRAALGPAHVKTGKGISLVSVNGYGQPIATGGPAGPPVQNVRGIFVSGRRLAVIYPFDGMRIYELAGRSMDLRGAFPTRGFAIAVLASNGLLYVANSYDGVRIGRLERGGAVEWIGHLDTDEARDVAFLGGLLVIADGSGGLKIADVSDPARPRIVGRHASPYFISALAVSGRRAYLAGGLGGVEIVDLSAPERPSLVWRHAFSEVRGIAADGRCLYFADGYNGFRIYSIGRRDPAPLSVLDTPGWNCGCFVAGTTAYLADGGSGIVIADISNRSKPRTLGSLSLGTLTRWVFPRGKTLFAAAHTKGVAAIDVSDPRAPALLSWYDTADDGRGVFADDDYVYVASGSGGAYIMRYVH